jgi:trk system potassium uptake protein TrkA
VNKHVIIAGGGKTAYFLAKRFQERNYHVTVVEPNAEEARRLSRALRATVIIADASTPAGLADAEATPRDEYNLVACQLARSVHGVPRTIALVNDPEKVELFGVLGVNAILSPAELLGRLIEERTAADALRALFPLAEGRVSVSELQLPAGAPAVDRKLQSLDLSRGALVACVIRGERVVVPDGSTVLAAGDRLVVVAQAEHQGRTLRALLGSEE